MRHSSDIRSTFVLAMMCSVVFACTQADHPDSISVETVSIMDTKSVAGIWEGLVVRTPADRRDDWVTLRIQEDGSFHFETYRTIGVFSGGGQFSLKDGMLFAKNEKGASLTLQLQHHAGKDDRLLKAVGQSADGMTYTASLTPKGRRPQTQ